MSIQWIKPLKWITRRRIRPFLLLGVVGLIITQIVALSPSSLEESSSPSKTIEPTDLTRKDEGTLATGIPKNRIPEYTIDQFKYVASKESIKQWKLDSNTAFLYGNEKLVHALHVKAFLYNPDEQITIVTGKEAKYFMNKKDLEVFGDVKAVFPDGFEINSDYLRYLPNERIIDIPVTHRVLGGGTQSDGQKMSFTSLGLNFALEKSKIVLHENVRFTIARPDGKTTIESDHCTIQRDKQEAYFTMTASRPAAARFVKITQPTLLSRGRRADLRYGDFKQIVKYLTLFEDVLLKETGKKTSLRYATSNQADFDSNQNIIVLSQFPQVYQDNDTVTGDVIVMHRDTDIIEVENSNAFSQGQ